MADENVGTISYTLDAKTDALVTSNKSAQASLDAVENSLDNTAASSKRFDTQLSKTAKGVKTAGAGIRQMRGQLQNLSYQLQDSIVQAQMGTSAFTILGQQAPQALGSFGAGGAAVGVLVALGAALGGVISSAVGAGEAAKDYNDEIELLSQTVKVGENGIASFSDNFGKLAREKPEVAMSKIRGELSRVSSIMNIVSNDTNELVQGFGTSTYKIKGANEQLEGWTRTAEGLEDVINNKTLLGFTQSADAARLNVGGLQSVVISMNEELGLTTEESLGLVKALKNIDTPEGIIEASNYVSELASRLKGSSPEIDKLNVKFNEMSARAKNLINSQAALNKALEDTGRVSQSTEKQVEKNAEANIKAASVAATLADRIALQNIAMTEGEEAATRLAAEQALGNNVSESLKNTVGDLAVEYYRLTNAQKEAKKEASEQAAIDRRAQSAADQANMAMMSEVDQIKAKAQAQRDLINSSKTLTDAEKNRAISNINTGETNQLNQANFGTTDLRNIQLQETLGVSQQVAQQIETVDQKFQNLGTTMSDTLVSSAYSFADAMGQGLAQAIADGDSLNDALGNVASTIGTQLLGNLITLGLQYGINAALASTAGSAATAAATAQAAAAQAAWAPAALSASIATLGGATATGSAAYTTAISANQGISLAGGRLNGGPVSAGNAYEVTEDGKPEMLTVGGKNILMMGNQSGTVTSNKDMTSGSSGGGVVVNIQNNASGSEATATSREQDGKTIIDVVVADLNNRGKIHKTMTNTTTANNKV